MAGPCHQNEDFGRAIKQISFHPEYLKEFIGTQDFLLNGDGPLRYDIRHYIAIMAASRHKCRCLVNYHKHKFLALGGNVQWLQGLQHCPRKLRNLNEINTILAHSPWLIKKCHIERLTKGKDNWALGELCQAIVLLAHFHCLCSFVFACEILDSADECADAVNSFIPEDDTFEEICQETVEELMEKMSLLQKKEKETSGEEQRNPYELPQNEGANDYDMDSNDENSHPNNNCTDPDEKDRTEFLIQDCTWDDHAYCLLNRYYNEVGTILDEKFKVAYDLTYYTMGHKENVDTTIFRRAVWNYIHRIYGIVHDDYNYSEMEDLLEYGFRSYAETVCFYPEKITKDAHDQIMRAFRHSEKVHVNLMLFEARMQAELLYALSAIMHYMT